MKRPLPVMAAGCLAAASGGSAQAAGWRRCTIYGWTVQRKKFPECP